MHFHDLSPWHHVHTFGQDRKRPGEARTLIVIVITSIMMLVETAAGILFGSMALLADGLHMASHAAALGISAFAYVYARRHAHDLRFSFGTGKVNALGGFTGAVLLAVFALIMVWESVDRMIHPIAIAFDQAILVAVLGLAVNGASWFILNHRRTDRGHDPHDLHDDRHDHNLRAAYLHVLADALTSFLAIFALVAAKYLGLIWVDPLMGIVGAILVSRWSLGLLRQTGAILLDRQGSEPARNKIRESVESRDDNRVTDLHLWSIGPNVYGAILSVVTHDPKPPEHYKRLLPSGLGLVHVTVEVNPCLSIGDSDCGGGPAIRAA
jgi:cation diffusion facilitator family transporter